MSMTDEDRQQVAAMLETALTKATAGQTAQAQPAVPMMPASGMTGMAPSTGMMPAGQMVGQAVQPTGVSLLLTIPMPDGSEVPAQLHFGPEALANLPGLTQQVATTWPLKVYPPRQQRWGNGGAYGGNNRGNYGGRRW